VLEVSHGADALDDELRPLLTGKINGQPEGIMGFSDHFFDKKELNDVAIFK